MSFLHPSLAGALAFVATAALASSALATEAEDDARTSTDPAKQLGDNELPPPAPLKPMLRFGQDDGMRFELPIRVLGAVTNVGHSDIDRDGTNAGHESLLETRLRIDGTFHLNNDLSLEAQVDFISGALAGTSDVNALHEPHREVRWADPRALFIKANTGFGQFRVGHQLSGWGNGMVANSGDKGYEFGDMRFGWAREGDIVERFAFATKPLLPWGDKYAPLTLAVAGDLVFRDDIGDIRNGDLAFQGVFSLSWREDNGNHVGFYSVYRNQEENDGDTLEIVAIDVAADWRFPVAGAAGAMHVATEFVAIVGTTDLAASLTAPEHDVSQFGFSARIGYESPSLGVIIDTGYTSGDQNPDDDRLEAFRPDPDFNVGLILFEEVLAWQTARSTIRAGDPELVGLPSKGIDRLPSRGAPTGALWLFPKLRYAPLEWLEVFGGPLFAWSSVDVTDPFNTRVGGGTPRNYLNGDGNKRFYGTELDLGIGVRRRYAGTQLFVSLQGGVLLPGPAFENARGDRMSALGAGLLRFELRL